MRRTNRRFFFSKLAPPAIWGGLALALLLAIAALPPGVAPGVVRVVDAKPGGTPIGPPLRPRVPALEAPSVAVGATGIHDRGITGAGVTVAVVDSGLVPMNGRWRAQPDGSLLMANPSGRHGYIVFNDFVDPVGQASRDLHGHGTHVAATIGNARPLKSSGRGAMGVAPDANLVIARALGADGSGTYDSVIAAIDWVIATRDTYNTRVLNLSVYAPINGPYWADPLGRAVMRAWQAGLVVVAAAGNDGPGSGTVTVPGNVPYVITVGGARSPQFGSSGVYEVANFSARGPTESAFPKPDLLVPAVRVIAPMPDAGSLADVVAPGRLTEKAFLDIGPSRTQRQLGYYQLSGTSMAAAEVSGIVALLLQAEPGLTNNQVKQRLMAASRLALAPDGGAAYSIWEQGAGLLLAPAVFALRDTGAANAGMNIARDLVLEGEEHYWGGTTYDEATGDFRMDGPPDAPGGYLAWGGGWRAWAGGLDWSGNTGAWAGAWRAWAGSERTFAGAWRAWAGNAELWAGAWRAWAGNAPPRGDAPTTGELGNEDFVVNLPLLSGRP